MSTVELFGESFELHPDGVNPSALLFFALDSQDEDTSPAAAARQNATLMTLCLETIAEKDRSRYRRVMVKNRAEITDHMKVIEAAAVPAADRPTELPSGSSDGQPSTEPKSESVYERAARLAPGRPATQLAIVKSAQAS